MKKEYIVNSKAKSALSQQINRWPEATDMEEL